MGIAGSTVVPHKWVSLPVGRQDKACELLEWSVLESWKWQLGNRMKSYSILEMKYMEDIGSFIDGGTLLFSLVGLDQSAVLYCATMSCGCFGGGSFG